MMNKIGVWELDNPLQHWSGHGDIDQKDQCIDLLWRKLCPIHLTPLVLRKVTILGDDYTRKQYGCMTCRCVVDFVGSELKADSIVGVLHFFNLMINEMRGLEAAKVNPTDEAGVEV